MARNLEEIRKDQEGYATVRNLVAVLHDKLDLASRYGIYEFEATEEGLAACAATFEDLAHSEREQISRLLDLLPPTRRRRFKRGDDQPGSNGRDGGSDSDTGEAR